MEYHFLRSGNFKEPDPIKPLFNNDDWELDQSGTKVVTFEWEPIGDEFEYKVYVNHFNQANPRNLNDNRGTGDIYDSSDITSEATVTMTFNNHGMYEWYVVAFAKNGDFKIAGDNGVFHLKPYKFFELFNIRGNFVSEIADNDLYDKIYHHLDDNGKDRFTETYNSPSTGKGKFKYVNDPVYKDYLASGKAFRYIIDKSTTNLETYEGRMSQGMNEINELQIYDGGKDENVVNVEPYRSEIFGIRYDIGYYHAWGLGSKNAYWGNNTESLDRTTCFNIGTTKNLTENVHIYSRLVQNGTWAWGHHGDFQNLPDQEEYDKHIGRGNREDRIKNLAFEVYIYELDGVVNDL